jgi:hypothetical protein
MIFYKLYKKLKDQGQAKTLLNPLWYFYYTDKIKDENNPFYSENE